MSQVHIGTCRSAEFSVEDQDPWQCVSTEHVPSFAYSEDSSLKKYL